MGIATGDTQVCELSLSHPGWFLSQGRYSLKKTRISVGREFLQKSEMSLGCAAQGLPNCARPLLLQDLSAAQTELSQAPGILRICDPAWRTLSPALQRQLQRRDSKAKT